MVVSEKGGLKGVFGLPRARRRELAVGPLRSSHAHTVMQPVTYMHARARAQSRTCAMGCSARPMRNFSIMSRSLSKSRLTCTVQVRNIMSSPMLPTVGM